MRRELYRHREIGGLVEVVMDLDRFPSGDWVISQQHINHKDLQQPFLRNQSFTLMRGWNIFLSLVVDWIKTILIDEIGTELEALAASTIAQRGVVGTTHGTTIQPLTA
ncbi:hypothetical protein RYX36_025323 [Vicia faba]